MLKYIAVLAVLATPTFAQSADGSIESPTGSVAGDLDVSAPDRLMGAAVANCFAYSTTNAIRYIAAAGWAMEGDMGVTVLWRDDVTIEISQDEGFCRVSSPVVSMSQAAAVATLLADRDNSLDMVIEQDEQGCAVFSSDSDATDYIVLSSDGNDPTCDDTGQGGSALTYYTD